MKIKCFFLEPVNKQRIFLRRYCYTRTADNHHHDASVFWKDIDLVGSGISSCEMDVCSDDKDYCPDLSLAWPAKCDSCDYIFSESDVWHRFVQHLYRRKDNGELITLREAPVGAMYYADWLDDCDDYPKGPDGRVLEVIVPDGISKGRVWSPDERASNCTMKEDKIHRCWVRHGVPPEITVDKNGYTCKAGAGSIISGKWHGFLKNGYLTNE